MARNNIPRALILEREKQVWAMRIRGATYERIAKEMGMTFGGVSKMLSRMHDRYRKRNMHSVEKCIQEQIAELSNVADEAYRAWERSIGTKIIKKTQARSKDGKVLKGGIASEERIDQEGDPRYLQVYMKAKEDIRQLIGADAPVKFKGEMEHSGKNGEAIKIDAQTQLREMLNKALPPIVTPPDIKEDENG